VAAFHPQRQEFVHVELSTDADSWSKRKVIFERKFRDASKHYDQLFPFPKRESKRLAIVGFNKAKSSHPFGPEIDVILVPEFVRQICGDLRSKDPMKQAIPESLPLLRSMQYAMRYGVSRGMSFITR
jgi:hypothetical protein